MADYTITRISQGWSIETGDATLNVTDSHVDQGRVRAVLTARNGDTIIHRDTLNLTSERSRAKMVTALAEKGVTITDGVLIALDDVCRHPRAEEPESEPAGVPRPLPELLESAGELLSSFVVLNQDQRTALALWIAHTHAFDAADATAYIAVTSPEKRSGKTRLLEMLDLLVARPWLTGRTTAAALARKVDKSTPTLLLDESDATFNGEKEYAETLRGVLNTGHRRGGVVSVCVGKGAEMDVKDFSTFGPKAIAGIGKLPDTVADRAISIRMQRKAPGEAVTRFRRRDVVALTTPVHEEMNWWAKTAIDQLKDARPDIPLELDDRAADGWEPLLAIADTAGEEWSYRARQAAVALSTGAARDDDSLGVRLLGTLKALFQDVDRLATSTIIGDLNGREDEPWGAFNDGAGMRPRDLANMLRRYEVRPRNIRMPDGSVPKGYLWADLERVCARYVPDMATLTATSASRSQKQTTPYPLQDPSCSGWETTGVPHVQANVAAVADKTPLNSHKVAHTRATAPAQQFCEMCGALLPSAFHRELGQCPICIESSLRGAA